jgi:phosphodiesterase/alkaline phosphatase D-like protein
LVLLVALAIAASLSASAQAATYTVGDAKDVPGTCANPAAGTCSLRQLIDYEDKLASTPNPTDTIVVPAGTYALANGELEITQSLSIKGAGARTTHVELPAGASTARAFSVKIPAEGKTPSVLISGLEISGGTAGENNGYFGGDVYNAGELTLAEDWITGGTASSGGGVSNDTGTLVVDRSLVSGNVASTGGGDSGGIQNHGSAVCVRACTPGKRGVLTVEDSTVAYNEARLGAGIFSWSDDGVADENLVTVIDSTIAYNTAKEETEGPARGLGAGLLINAGTADVAGSILAYNAEIDEEGEYVATDCSTTSPGTIHSDGYNLENDADCGFTAKGDLEETFPDFTSAEPQNNGGATNTLGLEATSPGVDAIPKGNQYCVGTDQRGVTRPQGAGCAMGAYELVPFTIEAVEGSQFSGELATARCGIFGTPTIEWGDGKSSKATVTESEISGTHTYEEAGTYNGFVDYEDDCGTYKVPFQARVADAPLSATGEAVNGTVGVQFSGTVAKFTDANPDGKVSQYTASINWGDGSSASAGTIKAAEGGGFLVSGSHTYAAVGSYPTSVTIKDVGGAEATASGSAKITGPPLISEVKAGSVAETSANVEFTLAPQGLETTYEVEYGLTEAYGSKSASGKLAATAGPTHESVALSGLKAGSTYHFRVVAKNAQASTGVHSEDKTFATLGPPVITEVSVGSIAETSAKVEFTLAPAGSETTYEVEYGPTEAYGSKSASGKLAGPAGPTREAVTLPGLKAGSTYHYRVVAKNAQAPTGVHSEDKTFATLGPPVITEVSVGSIAETSAKVEFTLAPAGSETTYEVEYGPTEAYGQKSASAKLAGTAGPTREAVTLSALKAGSTYHFRVVAKNAQAPGGVASADKTFATLGPPVITEVKSASVAEVSAKVEFTLAPAGSETTYEVEYGTTEAYGQKSGSAKLAGSAGPTHEVVTLAGLKAGTTYHFRVVAKNAQAPGGVASADMTFATLGPPVISEVGAAAITETSAKIEFTLAPAGAETTYEVEYGLTEAYGQKSASAKLAGAAGPTRESVALSGLKAHSTYHFRVVAKNAQAPGGVASADMTFVTLGPPVISEVTSGSVTETSAKVEFTLAPEGSETTYEVEYGPTEAYGSKSASAKLASTAGPTHEAVTLSGLKADSAYHFRVVAKNAQALAGVHSADGKFTTLGPPAISEVSVGSITETTANVGFILDPAGSETTYEVEYGPTEGYGQTSGPAKLAAGAGPTHETVTLSGLQADSTFYFRVVATNSQAKTGVKSAVEHFTTEPQSGPGAGGTGSPSGQQGVSGFQSSSAGGATLGSLPPPVLGVNVNVDVVSGKVFVAYPLGSQLASLSDVLEEGLVSPLRAIESLSKGLHFVPLTEARQIPVGSVLETTAGVARIETATASINKPQFGNFGAGIFKLLQARKQKGLTELDIMDAHSTRQVCASLGKRAAVAAKLSSKVLGRLNANAHGKFTTKGQYSAATVRGTVWNVANQCDGTLTKVQRGVVSVRDFVRRKTITLFTGQHYLARP